MIINFKKFKQIFKLYTGNFKIFTIFIVGRNYKTITTVLNSERSDNDTVCRNDRSGFKILNNDKKKEDFQTLFIELRLFVYPLEYVLIFIK